MVSPILKRPLSSRPRQKGSHESSKIRELDRGQIVFVLIVEGMVTLELAFSATLNGVLHTEHVTIVSRDWMPNSNTIFAIILFVSDVALHENKAMYVAFLLPKLFS